MRIPIPLPSRRAIYGVSAAIVVAAIAITTSYLSGKTAPAHNANNDVIPVTTGVATRADVPDVVNALGTIQSIDSVSVQPRVGGTIEKIEFTPGQDVKQNQELFLIDPRPYQAALDMAKAQLAHDQGLLAEAELDLTRYQLLAQQNSIAKQQAQDQAYVVEQDKGTVQLDQANIENAQLNLAYCHVTSPIAGRAGVLLADLGNLVGPTSSQGSSSSGSTATNGSSQSSNNAMVVIAQIKPIYVSFSVPQNRLDEIKRNQAAAPLEVQAYSQDSKLLETGTLTLIDNTVNTGTGTVLMQATFANADEGLWPGEFVRARLVVSMRRNVVTVPAQAVMPGPSGSYVYVISPGDTVRRVNVEVTDRQGGTAIIGKGLSGGEHVVVDGQYRLAEGVKIKVRDTAEASSL